MYVNDDDVRMVARIYLLERAIKLGHIKFKNESDVNLLNEVTLGDLMSGGVDKFFKLFDRKNWSMLKDLIFNPDGVDKQLLKDTFGLDVDNLSGDASTSTDPVAREDVFDTSGGGIRQLTPAPKLADRFETNGDVFDVNGVTYQHANALSAADNAEQELQLWRGGKEEDNLDLLTVIWRKCGNSWTYSYWRALSARCELLGQRPEIVDAKLGLSDPAYQVNIAGASFRVGYKGSEGIGQGSKKDYNCSPVTGRSEVFWSSGFTAAMHPSDHDKSYRGSGRYGMKKAYANRQSIEGNPDAYAGDAMYVAFRPEEAVLKRGDSTFNFRGRSGGFEDVGSSGGSHMKIYTGNGLFIGGNEGVGTVRRMKLSMEDGYLTDPKFPGIMKRVKVVGSSS